MQRYFVSKKNNNFILQESDFHHIKDVMRLKNNDQIICSNDGKSYLCTINFLHNNEYQITIVEELKNDNELPINVILYQALIKNDKFDLIVQKSCELGVHEIYPVICARSVIKISEEKADKKIARYEKIIKEACEQSTRDYLPKMHEYISLKNIKVDANTLPLIAYEKNNDVFTLAKAVKNIKDYKNVAVIIGPEGGFDESEVEYLSSIGFVNVSLGKRILRAETAAMYALSIIGHYIEGVDYE